MSGTKKMPRDSGNVSLIARARLSAGLTQSQLAGRIGVAAQHVGRWERGERKPKIDALIKIADALGCDVRDLMA